MGRPFLVAAMSTQRLRAAHGPEVGKSSCHDLDFSGAGQTKLFLEFAGIDQVRLCENGRRTQPAAVAPKPQFSRKQWPVGRLADFA
jgi:hypothetical protein